MVKRQFLLWVKFDGHWQMVGRFDTLADAQRELMAKYSRVEVTDWFVARARTYG